MSALILLRHDVSSFSIMRRHYAPNVVLYNIYIFFTHHLLSCYSNQKTIFPSNRKEETVQPLSLMCSSTSSPPLIQVLQIHVAENRSRCTEKKPGQQIKRL